MTFDLSAATLFAVLLAGCDDEARIVSPSPKSVLRYASWTPLVVHMPKDLSDVRVGVLLDGVPIDDPSPIVRARMSKKGGGKDYISTLDLTGLRPGEHRLDVEVVAGARAPFTASGVFAVDHAPVRVECRVTDGTAPVAARILVLDDRDQPFSTYPRSTSDADPRNRDRLLSSVFLPHGEGTIFLDSGRWKLVAVRGIRDATDVRVVDLDQALETVEFRVPRVVADPERLSADLHVHTGRSADAYVPDQPRFEAIAAAGLDVFVMSDHLEVFDPQPLLDALGITGIHGIPGVEGRTKLSMHPHYNVFPADPSVPPPSYDLRPVAAHIDAWRARRDPGTGLPPVLILNHPRGIQFKPKGKIHRNTHALFTRLGFDPLIPPGQGRNGWMTRTGGMSTTTNMDWDAIELVNRTSFALYRIVRKDWFSLLDNGWYLVGVGDSDSHALAVEPVGFPVNLVQVPDGVFDLAEFTEAVRGGRVAVSTGPVVDLRVEAEESIAVPGGVLVASEAKATVTVEAAAWVPVPEVRLVVDGRTVERYAPNASDRGPDGTLRVTRTWTVRTARDGWLLAEAGPDPDVQGEPEQDPLYAAINPGGVAFGFTNPVRLDPEGDGWGR